MLLIFFLPGFDRDGIGLGIQGRDDASTVSAIAIDCRSEPWLSLERQASVAGGISPFDLVDASAESRSN